MGAARRLVDPAHALPEFARRVFAFVEEARRQQDNEQWHLLILEELLRERGERQGLLRFVVAPQFLALAFYHVSWILYVLRCAPLRNARRSKISATRPLEPHSGSEGTASAASLGYSFVGPEERATADDRLEHADLVDLLGRL